MPTNLAALEIPVVDCGQFMEEDSLQMVLAKSLKPNKYYILSPEPEARMRRHTLVFRNGERFELCATGKQRSGDTSRNINWHHREKEVLDSESHLALHLGIFMNALRHQNIGATEISETEVKLILKFLEV